MMMQMMDEGKSYMMAGKDGMDAEAVRMYMLGQGKLVPEAMQPSGPQYDPIMGRMLQSAAGRMEPPLFVMQMMMHNAAEHHEEYQKRQFSKKWLSLK